LWVETLLAGAAELRVPPGFKTDDATDLQRLSGRWPFEGERPADWDRAGEISRVAMLLARQQALMQPCRQRHDAVERRKVTLRAELTESLIRMSGQLPVMRAVAERADPTVAKVAAALRARYTPNTPTSA